MALLADYSPSSYSLLARVTPVAIRIMRKWELKELLHRVKMMASPASYS
jgi:hypothetical protein